MSLLNKILGFFKILTITDIIFLVGVIILLILLLLLFYFLKVNKTNLKKNNNNNIKNNKDDDKNNSIKYIKDDNETSIDEEEVIIDLDSLTKKLKEKKNDALNNKMENLVKDEKDAIISYNELLKKVNSSKVLVDYTDEENFLAYLKELNGILS